MSLEVATVIVTKSDSHLVGRIKRRDPATSVALGSGTVRESGVLNCDALSIGSAAAA